MKVSIKKILTIVYFLAIIFIVLTTSGTILWTDKCVFYEFSATNRIRTLGPFIVMGIIGFLYVKINGIKNFPFRYYFLLPVLTLFFIVPFYEKHLNSRIENDEHTIAKAVIYNIDLGQRTHACSFRFRHNNEIAKSNKSTKIKYLKKLQIGDTILIKVTKDCKYMNKLYDLFPTKDELDKIQY